MRAEVTGRTELPLVVFTVLTQAGAGSAVVGFLLGPERTPEALRPVALALFLLGGLVALLHLGRPGRAPLALANVASSWLSRELLLGLAFAAALALVGGPAAAVAGLAFVAAVAMVYRIRTVPPWNHWATPAAFFGTAFLLGGGVAGLLLSVRRGSGETLRLLGPAVLALALLVVAVFAIHTRRFGRPAAPPLLLLRSLLPILGAGLLLLRTPAPAAAAVLLLFAAELLGRFLFYSSHVRIGL